MVLPLSKKVLLIAVRVMDKPYFTSFDVALISVFCALWVVLNLTLGPLGFAWFGLPIFCDFSVFLTLLLVTWATGKFGAASFVGVVGSIIVLLIRAVPSTIGLTASAILFDVLMSMNRHTIDAKARNITISALVTVVSAYFAGVVIGIFFTNRPLDLATLNWSLTFWGGWHLVGGLITVAIAMPIIGVLERTKIRKSKNAR